MEKYFSFYTNTLENLKVTQVFMCRFRILLSPALTFYLAKGGGIHCMGGPKTHCVRHPGCTSWRNLKFTKTKSNPCSCCTPLEATRISGLQVEPSGSSKFGLIAYCGPIYTVKSGKIANIGPIRTAVGLFSL